MSIVWTHACIGIHIGMYRHGIFTKEGLAGFVQIYKKYTKGN